MTITGFPLSTRLPSDLNFGERFWYWRGASGRTYIHSIYPADACPPLPGAVYVAVGRHGLERRAIATGRFASFWEGPSRKQNFPAEANEIHVHLLACDEQSAKAVAEDLRQAFTAATYPALAAA